METGETFSPMAYYDELRAARARGLVSEFRVARSVTAGFFLSMGLLCLVALGVFFLKPDRNPALHSDDLAPFQFGLGGAMSAFCLLTSCMLVQARRWAIRAACVVAVLFLAPSFIMTFATGGLIGAGISVVYGVFLWGVIRTWQLSRLLVASGIPLDSKPSPAAP